ncbi:MAG: aconitase X catalytic domain-containing protein [Acidaminococcales bacterium]|jgi:predicted aconitase|nr:aconitase X catalytic domain-containing protein [Acidaminococcales bacterium]
MGIKLTQAEEDMLRGKNGEACKVAMGVLLRLGNALGAQEFVRVSSVQCMAHYGSLHDAGLEWLEKLGDMGGRCCVPATQDPASIPFEDWEEMGFDKVYADKQQRLAAAAKKLGEVLTWSCTPYAVGQVPRFGQNIAWAESSAVSYANSVIGARTNRTPAGMAVCVALTGRVPKERMYLDENRAAAVKVNIRDAGELTELDYNTIGIMLGKFAGTRIVAFDGIPESVSNEGLKYLGAAAASSGGVALYHVLGVTPEAFREDPFRGQKPAEEVTWTRRDIQTAQDALTTQNPGEVELAVVGCPHYSIGELIKLADLARGRKIKKGKEFWVYTPFETRNLAERMGLADVFRESGVRILASNCLVISPFPRKYKTLMTDSAKFASYLPSEHHVELVYGSMADCVNTVMN